MFKLRITGDLGFEFWQDIPEYEGEYQVSTYGRIRGVDRLKKSCYGSYSILKGQVLKPFLSNRGYELVTLCSDKKKNQLVHILVAKTFLPKWKKEYTEINHVTEDLSENSVQFLEWCTPDYNLHYGTRAERIGEKHSKAVIQIDINGKSIHEYKSQREAARTIGAQESDISVAIKRQSIYKGYYWKRKGE